MVGGIAVLRLQVTIDHRLAVSALQRLAVRAPQRQLEILWNRGCHPVTPDLEQQASCETVEVRLHVGRVGVRQRTMATERVDERILHRLGGTEETDKVNAATLGFFYEAGEERGLQRIQLGVDLGKALGPERLQSGIGLGVRLGLRLRVHLVHRALSHRLRHDMRSHDLGQRARDRRDTLGGAGRRRRVA